MKGTYKPYCPLKEYPEELKDLIDDRLKKQERTINITSSVGGMIWKDTPEGDLAWRYLCTYGDPSLLIAWHNEHNTEFLKELRGNPSYSIF